MKRIFLLSFLLNLLALCSLLYAGAPIKAYKLNATHETVAKPSGITYFQLKGGLDTVNGDWLSVGANPRPLPEPGSDVSQEAGISLGFSFPFHQENMTVFGVSGEGTIYLGTPGNLAPVSSAGGSNNAYIMNIIDATFYATNSSGQPSAPATVAVDAQSKVGYVLDAAQGVLTIVFENMILSDRLGATQKASYRVVLNKSGNITLYMDLLPIEPATLAKPLYAFSYLIKAKDNEDIIAAKDWNGTSTSATSGNKMLLSKPYPSVPLQLVWSLPPTCEAPTVSKVDIEYEYLYASALSASLKESGSMDGVLVFLSEHDKSISEKPVNKKTYRVAAPKQAPDSIGGCTILAYSKNPSIQVSDLKANTSYDIYVYSYSQNCSDGPFYTSEPIKIAFKTTKGSPKIRVEKVGENSATLKLEGLEAGEKVLIGYADNEYVGENNYISLKKETYHVGDTLFSQASWFGDKQTYLISTYYTGTPTENEIKLENLESGEPYFFYVWGIDKEGKITNQYEIVRFRTLASIPASFTFYHDALYEAVSTMPCGWSRTEGDPLDFRLSLANSGLLKAAEPTDAQKNRHLSVFFRANPANLPTICRANAITPIFKTTHDKINVMTHLKFARLQGRGSVSVQLREGDTIFIEYKTTEEEVWHPCSLVTDANVLDYQRPGGYGLVLSTAQVPMNKNIQLRYIARFPIAVANEAYDLHIREVEIEPNLDCKYPTDMEVYDSLVTHRAVAIQWVDRNKPASPYSYSFRELGTEQWSEEIKVKTSSYLQISPIKAQTTYEIKLKAVCSDKDSSLSREIVVTSLGSLPLEETFSAKEQMSETFSQATGKLALTGNTELKYTPLSSGSWKMQAVSIDASPTCGIDGNKSDSWLILPALCMEDKPAPASVELKIAAYQQIGTEKMAIPDTTPSFVLVLVSPDGQFNASHITDTIWLKGVSHTAYTLKKIDLSEHIRQLHIALVFVNPKILYARDSKIKFLVDSISVDYDGDRPCLGVEDVNQYNLTTNSVDVSWTGYSTEYAVIYQERNGETYDTVFTKETSCTLPNLKPGTMYLYWVGSYCDEGHRSPGPLSEEAFFYTADTCAIPTLFSVVSTTWESVTLVAKAASGKICHIYAKDPTLPFNYSVGGWGASVDTFTITGLREKLNVTYYVQVRGFCGEGDSSAWSEPIEFTTDKPVCDKPTQLKSVPSLDEVDLSWSPGAGNDYYRLLFKKVSDPNYDTMNVSLLKYKVSKLKPNTAYTWKLQGVCDNAFLSAFATDNFTTLSVGIENKNQSHDFKIFSRDGQVVILNPSQREINQVELYDTRGTVLYHLDANTFDNLTLPSITSQHQVIVVRVWSGASTFIYKIGMN